MLRAGPDKASALQNAWHCLSFEEADICSTSKAVQNRPESPEHNSPDLLPGTCSDGGKGGGGGGGVAYGAC